MARFDEFPLDNRSQPREFTFDDVIVRPRAHRLDGQFVTNSTILASASHGIDRGWRGSNTDFLATNTFTSIAKCKQSYPKDATGACPATVPCP